MRTGIPLRVLLVTTLVSTLGVTRVDDLCSVFGDQLDHACVEDNIHFTKSISNVYRYIVHKGASQLFYIGNICSHLYKDTAKAVSTRLLTFCFSKLGLPFQMTENYAFIKSTAINLECTHMTEDWQKLQCQRSPIWNKLCSQPSRTHVNVMQI